MFTCNNCTDKDSFDFTKDIAQQSFKLFMASLDADFLFTNASLDENVEICINELFQSSQTVLGLNKQRLLQMFLLTIKESVIFFILNIYTVT